MTETKRKISETIIDRINADGARYHAEDNISQYILDGELEQMKKEAEAAYAQFLDALVVDRFDDPNSYETAKRVAKMYIDELFQGRYQPGPKVTAFPNIDTKHTEKFGGLLVVRAELDSICSHHHQNVRGTAFIGILPSDMVIGLSKYIRIAQHEARRGTLQENLANAILRAIMKATKSRDVVVYIEAEHGCVSCRGAHQKNSMTQTTALAGQFFKGDLKNEFFDNIKRQK